VGWAAEPSSSPLVDRQDEEAPAGFAELDDEIVSFFFLLVAD
jgi:hypothetical protein